MGAGAASDLLPPCGALSTCWVNSSSLDRRVYHSMTATFIWMFSSYQIAGLTLSEGKRRSGWGGGGKGEELEGQEGEESGHGGERNKFLKIFY